MIIYSVYWIHLLKHSNILTEGYVGVTKNTKRRFGQHKSNTYNQDIKRYCDDAVFTVILCGSLEYCYEIEEKLRPSAFIGWNIVPGGRHSAGHTGKKHSPEALAKMRTKRTKKHPSRTEQAKFKTTIGRAFSHARNGGQKRWKNSQETIFKREIAFAFAMARRHYC